MTLDAMADAIAPAVSAGLVDVGVAIMLAITPTTMTDVQAADILASGQYPVTSAGPLLAGMFPSDTAAAIAALLTDAYTGVGENDVATALAACDFNILQTAPAVAQQFFPSSPQQSDVNNLAAALAAAYGTSTTAMQVSLALAACSAVPAADIPPAVASTPGAPTSEQATLVANSLNVASGTLLTTAAAQASSATPAAVATALLNASAGADPTTISGLVLSVCVPQPGAAALDGGVTAGYTAVSGTVAPTTTQMAAAMALCYAPLTAIATAALLEGAGFDPSDTALALFDQFGTDASTPALIASLLAGAFSSLTDVQLDEALAACNFALAAALPSVVSQFSSLSLSTVVTDIVSAYQTLAPPTAVQLAIGLTAQPANEVSPAIVAALPGTTADQMAAVLLVSSDPDMASAFATAQSEFAAGDSATDAVAAIVSAQSSIALNTAAGALFSAYTPPQLTATVLSAALTSNFSGSSASDIDAAVSMCFAPGVVAGETTVLAPIAGSYVSIPSISAYSFSGTGDFSVQAELQSASSGNGGMILQCQASSTSPGWALAATSSSLELTTCDSSGDSVNYTSTSASDLFDGNWHTVVATRQTTSGASTYAIYLDGTALEGFQPTDTTPLDVTNTASLTIGAAVSGWVGNVANVYLFPDAQTGTGTGTPVGNWPFTDGTADDASSNDNNGTLEGNAALVQGTP